MTRDEQEKEYAEPIEVLAHEIEKIADQAKGKIVDSSYCFRTIEHLSESIIVICRSLFG